MSGTGDGGAAGERYDPDRYRAEIVLPLRGTPRNLPTDLRVRYAISGEPTRDILARHLATVLADWAAGVENTREGDVYAALLDAHETLAADPCVNLWDADWWASYRAPAAVPTVAVAPRPPRAPAAAPRVTARQIGEPRSTPLPSRNAEPEPDVGVTEPATPVDLRPEPTACRTGDEVEVAWIWPRWATEAFLQWDGHRTRLTRHEYQQRGCWRSPMRDERTVLTVELRGVDRAGETRTVEVPARRQEVHYSIRRSWWRPGTRRYTVTFTTDRPPMQWCEIAVGYSGDRALPASRDEVLPLGEPAPVAPGSLSLAITLPRGCQARWLRCFLVEGDEVVLVDPDVDRLRVRPWPR